MWTQRDGKRLDPVGDARYEAGQPALSPDGRQVTFVARDEEDNTLEVWVRNLDRGTETRLTSDETIKFGPTWTPSSERILFSNFDPTNPSVSVFTVPADGSDVPHLLWDRGAFNGFGPDGEFALVSRQEGDGAFSTTANWHLWLVPLSGETEPRLLVGGEGRKFDASVSPDGRWLVYMLERRDKKQVYLTRYPEATGRWQVSVEEGDRPRWDPRGDRLYYSEGSRLVEVTVGPGNVPALGKPVDLFEHAGDFAVSPDGESFLIVDAVTAPEDEEARRPGIKVVQNWIREFRR